MSPFVKRKEKEKKKGLRWKGSFLPFLIHCSLSWWCVHSPSHKHTFSSCMPLFESKRDSKPFQQMPLPLKSVFSSIFLSVAWIKLKLVD